MTAVNDFYNRIQFPGHYSHESLTLQAECLTNPYLKFIDRYLGNGLSVLDAGCGTGLISNLFAQRYPQSEFTGVDFADSIDYAKTFALRHKINNVAFMRQDLTKLDLPKKFDVVISQGVLHHIPDFVQAVERLQQHVRPSGRIIVGLYHPAGKILKRWVNINYGNQILYEDQECNPWERSFNKSQVKHMWSPMVLADHYPNWAGNVAVPSFFNSRNGGLVTYVFE